MTTSNRSVLALLAILVALLLETTVSGAFVYETSAEFLAAGDFNGDGALDVLVLDKATGNARVGYLDASGGVLIWSSPLATGVENATGCAVGRFLSTGKDALAITTPELNCVHLVSLANTNAAGTPVIVTPAGLGPHTLVTLANPLGGAPPPYNFLLAASSFNAPPNERLDLLALSAGVATAAGQFSASAPFEHGNALQLPGISFAAGLLRGANDAAFLEAQFTSDTNLVAGITDGITDILQIWQFTNTAAPVLQLSNLAPGSDYVFGLFNGEALPRFAFYVAGQSNLILQPLMGNGAALAFGSTTSLAFTQAVQRVFYLDRGGDGSFIIQFGSAVQGLSFPGGAATPAPLYQGTLGAAGNLFTGVIPLSNGQLTLLDAPAGSPGSVHSQTLRFDGTNYLPQSETNLPPITSRSLRANVWLFRNEPFVDSAPGFVASASVLDWTDYPIQPSADTASAETDTGPSAGLSSPVTAGLGPVPSGTLYAVPNQYDPLISIFSYSGTRTGDLANVRISPPPGIYPGALQISFFTADSYDGLNSVDHVLYRLGPSAPWRDYGLTPAPFRITNDVTIQYYATNQLSAGRSRLLSASYNLGNPVGPSNPANFDPGDTNHPPVNTNLVRLSPTGTLFYGRRSATDAGTIWAINLDGTDDTYITQGARPRASRDGRYLAFLREGSPFTGRGNIWRRDLVTGTEDRLLVNPDVIIGFDWFTDDSALIADFGCTILKLETNATHSTYVVGGQCYDNAPVLSPVDGRIAFHNASNAPVGLYVAAANGTGRTNILGSVGGAIPAWPAWSHDGAQLSISQGPTGQAATRNLYVVEPDGAGLSQLTAFSDPTNGWPSGALWFPSDNALVGAGEYRGTNGLWIVPLNQSRTACEGTLSRLPTSPGDPIDFAGTIVVAAAPVPPVLFVRQELSRVVVYWQTNSAGFSLEVAAGLAAAWTPLSAGIAVVGDYYEYAEPRVALRATKFFRLHWQKAP